MACNGVKYDRTVFASQADNVIIVQLKASKKGALAFEMFFDSQLNHKVETLLGRMVPKPAKGIDHADLCATVDGVDQEGVKAGLQAACRLYVESDGDLNGREKSIVLENASFATIYIAAATNFVNYHDVSGDPVKKNNEALAAWPTTSRSIRNSITVLLSTCLSRPTLVWRRTSVWLPSRRMLPTSTSLD